MPSVQSSSKTKQKHIHKVKRVSFSTGNKIYFCVLPDCNYKVKVAMALGKQVICWRCEQPFYLNEYSIRLAKPHCESCHKSKDDIKLPTSVEIMNDLRNLGDGTKLTFDNSIGSLADRLKQASQINHTILKDEEEEL